MNGSAPAAVGCRNLGVGLALGFLLTLAGCAVIPAANAPAEPAVDLLAVAQSAAAAYDQQDWVTAEQQYLAITRGVPAEVEPWFRLGNIYARTDRPALAVAAYREAVIRQPANGKAWHNMGIVQMREAMKSFAEIRKYVPEDDPLYARSRDLNAALEALMTTE